MNNAVRCFHLQRDGEAVSVDTARKSIRQYHNMIQHLIQSGEVRGKALFGDLVTRMQNFLQLVEPLDETIWLYALEQSKDNVRCRSKLTYAHMHMYSFPFLIIEH